MNIQAFDEAIRNGDLGTARAYLRDHPNAINVRNLIGETPLTEAIKIGRTSIVEALLSFPMLNVNSRNEDGYTPLMVAVLHNNLDIVRILINIPNVDLFARSTRGNYSAYELALQGTNGIIRNIAWQMATEINRHTIDQATRRAAASANTETASPTSASQNFFQHATSRTRNVIQRTPAREETTSSSSSSSSQNSEQAAASSATSTGIGLRAPTEASGSPADADEIIASIRANRRNATFLNLFDPNGDTPLIAAIRTNNTALFQALLNAEGCDINAFNTQGETALMIAASLGLDNYVSVLVQTAGININLSSRAHKTAEQIAQEANHPSTVAFIHEAMQRSTIPQNSAANIPSVHQFLEAAANGDLETAGRYIAANRDNAIAMNAPDPFPPHNTALMYAAEDNRLEVFNALLDCSGVNINARNVHGDTSLMIVARCHHTDLITRLIAMPHNPSNAVTDLYKKLIDQYLLEAKKQHELQKEKSEDTPTPKFFNDKSSQESPPKPHGRKRRNST